MLDTDFSRAVRAAQSGDEVAFARLWRDANPLLVRYLRVVGYDDPYDGACEAWITVVRGLADFSGDERDWLVWLLSCARARAHEGSLRRAWGSVSVTPGVGLPVGTSLPDDVEELASAAVDDPRTRGIADSLAALRSLPLGQGEVLLLRYGAGLSVRDTARVTGVDEESVDRLALRGLERLAVDVDLLRWSLTAPRSVAELADERVVLGAFAGRSRAGHRGAGRAGRAGGGRPEGPSGARHHGSRVIATVAVPSAADASRNRSRRTAVRPGGTGFRPGGTGLRSGGTTGRSLGAAGVVGRRSRGAALAVAALSASVMSLGGLTAAAYVGALPAPVQQAMHDAIGAPAPAAGTAGPSARGGSSVQDGGSQSAAAGPSSSAVVGLCRAWSADQAAGTPRDRSTAFRDLAARAGGAARVEAYCAATATSPTSQSSPGHTPTPHPTTPGRGGTKTPNPQSTNPGRGTTKTSPVHPTQGGKGSSTPPAQSTAPGKGGSTPSKPHATQPGNGSTKPSGSASKAPVTTPSSSAPAAPPSGSGKGGGTGGGTGGGSGGAPGRTG